MRTIRRHTFARFTRQRLSRQVGLLAILALAACAAPGGSEAPEAVELTPNFGRPSGGGTEPGADGATRSPADPAPSVDAAAHADTVEASEEPDTGPDAPPEPPPTGCQELTAVIGTDVTEGPLPLTVAFDSAASCTPKEIAESWWSFGDVIMAGRDVSYTFLGTGQYTVTLTLTDIEGAAHATTVQITVEPGLCPFSAGPVTTGLLALNELNEPSGLAVSPTLEDVIWTHNDSDGLPRLYAVDGSGQSIAAFDLAGASNVDWEDIAAGRDPVTGLVNVYVWDGGDNDATRTSVQIYMVSEPTAEVLAIQPSPMLASARLDLTYPDGLARNSDTLLFDPQTGDLYVVAIQPGSTTSDVFHKSAPHVPGSQTELSWVHSLTFGEAPLLGQAYTTGGSISPLGDRILLRTRDSAYLWLRDGSEPLAAAFDVEPCPGPFLVEESGESIEFSADGLGYYTMAEQPHADLLFSAFGEPDACDGLEARFDVTPVGALHVPVEVTFSVDETCVPAGLNWANWTIDGVATSELQPTVTFVDSGPIDVSLTVKDNEGASDTTNGVLDLLPPTCPYSAGAETWGALALEDINETSGVVVSAKSDGVLWVHNDSGDTARFFAVGFDGADLGTWSLDTSIKDWEDLAYGYDEILDTEVLYIGDVGDNALSRSNVTIYIVPEPDVDPAEAPTTTELETWHSMVLTYPDGVAHNCETLLRDPQTGDLYLVTKSSDGISPVFRKAAPHEDGTEAELEWSGALVFGTSPLEGSPSTTAGGFSPTGDRILIRTYTHAWLWHREPGQTIAEALATEVCNVNAPDEPQGEAICFSGDGDGYITISEGVGSTVYFTPLQ